VVEFVLASFTALFVTVSPIKAAAIFPVLTGGVARDEQRRMAVRAVLVACGLLVVFALFGDDLLRVIGISLAGVRVGGGILLMLLSIDIVFGRAIGPAPTAAEHGEDDASDISVFPLATPIIAGPGAITAVVVQATEARNGILTTVVLLAVIAAIMLLTLGGLLAAETVQRWLGHTGMSVVVRILGILLAAVSAEMILTGLRDSGIFSQLR
jgi:multiple antibiotic resistance protein